MRGDNFLSLKKVILGIKNENFMLISKILICLSDKMFPKKFKLKTVSKGPNLAKSQFVKIFYFNFCWGYIYIFEISGSINFFIPKMTCFKKKNFTS
jgi:hypothetical protein